jgi:hypothetical protein
MGQCTSKTLGTHNSLQWKSVDTKMVGPFIAWRNLNCFLHLCCPDRLTGFLMGGQAVKSTSGLLESIRAVKSLLQASWNFSDSCHVMKVLCVVHDRGFRIGDRVE